MPALSCFQPVSVTSTSNYNLSSPVWSTEETVIYYFLLLATPIGHVTEIVILNVDDDPCGNQSLLGNRIPFLFGFILKFSKSTLSKLLLKY